jgi:hypothetical protein
MSDDGGQQRDYHGSAMSNGEFTQAGVLQLRLDTQPMLDGINNFLRGRALVGYKQDAEGMFVPVFGDAGRPKANEVGIQSLMSWLTPLFSPHTVQGNFKDREELNLYLCYVQKGLAKYLMANREEWEVTRADYSGIIRMVMVTAEPFYSRLIGNKERESYGQTMRVHETNSFGEPQKRGGFLSGIFPSRRRD